MEGVAVHLKRLVATGLCTLEETSATRITPSARGPLIVKTGSSLILSFGGSGGQGTV